MNTEISPWEKVNYAIAWIRKRLPVSIPSVLVRWDVIDVASHLSPVPTSAVPTAGTDGKHLYFNPVFIGSLSIGAVVCIILHEVAHVLYGHPQKMSLYMARKGIVKGSMESIILKERHNKAADLAINSLLTPLYAEAGGLEEVRPKGCFPRHGKYAGFPEDQSHEYYLKLLEEEDAAMPPVPVNPGRFPGEPCDDGETGSGGQAGDSSEAGDSGQGDQGDQAGGDAGSGDSSGSETGDGDGSDSGSGSGSQAGDGSETGDKDSKSDNGESYSPDFFGSFEPYPAETLEEAEEAEREWKQTSRMALTLGCGDGVGDKYSEALADEVSSKPDENYWIFELRRFMQRNAPAGYSYNRPNRRRLGEVILPAFRYKASSDGLFIVDSSGSMLDRWCNRGLIELGKILEAYPYATVQLVSIDTALYLGDKYLATDFPLRKLPKWGGRGGTELAPAFAYAKETHFDWIVCISDMDWSYRQVPNPGIPTIWLGIGEPGTEHDGPVPFGSFVSIPDAR